MNGGTGTGSGLLTAAAPLHWAEASTAATECHRARVAGGDYLVLRTRLSPGGPYLARRVTGFHQPEGAREPFPTLAAAQAWCEAHYQDRASARLTRHV